MRKKSQARGFKIRSLFLNTKISENQLNEDLKFNETIVKNIDTTLGEMTRILIEEFKIT